MSGANHVELYDRETDAITTVRLYRIMSLGHLEEPNEEAEFRAVLRACKPQEERRDPARRTTFEEREAIVPRTFEVAVLEAFRNDRHILAEIDGAFMKTLVVLPEPLRK